MRRTGGRATEDRPQGWAKAGHRGLFDANGLATNTNRQGSAATDELDRLRPPVPARGSPTRSDTAPHEPNPRRLAPLVFVNESPSMTLLQRRSISQRLFALLLVCTVLTAGSLLSNVLWVAWGWHAQAFAVLGLQIALATLNIHGVRKTESNA